jgi:hypothetical protein
VIGRISFLTLALTACVRAAAAQEVTLTPVDPKQWDASISIGWLGGDKHDVAERWNDWYDTFATSVDVGRYWTPNLKTELSATLTSGGTIYSTQQIAGPGRPIFISREHAFDVRALNASATYQFLENAWAHPFLSAGVHVACERERVATFPFVNDPFPPRAPVRDTRTRVDVQPFISGGTKFYVSEQGFIRTDLSAAFDGRGVSRVWWRVGGGIDF